MVPCRFVFFAYLVHELEEVFPVPPLLLGLASSPQTTPSTILRPPQLLGLLGVLVDHILIVLFLLFIKVFLLLFGEDVISFAPHVVVFLVLLFFVVSAVWDVAIVHDVEVPDAFQKAVSAKGLVSAPLIIVYVPVLVLQVNSSTMPT